MNDQQERDDLRRAADTACAELDRVRAELQRMTEALAEERMVREAAEQSEMRYHEDCVAAEAALRDLLAQQQQLVEQWRARTANGPTGKVYHLCARQLAALIDRSRQGAPRIYRIQQRGD